MNPRVLIIGAGLSGLTTAFRLRSQGFDISLVDQGVLCDEAKLSESVSRTDFSSAPLSNADKENSSSNAFPIVLHGYHHATWTLLKELETDLLLDSHQSVKLEFVRDTQQTIEFRHFPAPSPLHLLMGLLLFKGLPWRDRWSLIKKLEQIWEGDIQLPLDLDSQHVHAWLTTLGQSEEACQHIWDPLCQFFLGMTFKQSSAEYFTKVLTNFFLSSRQNSRTFLPSLNERTLFIKPLSDRIASEDIIVHTDRMATYFQYDSRGITGVKLDDGTILTADVYVSALPRRKFLSCLPERLLAKFSYFSNLSQLDEIPALIVHLETPDTTTHSRLLLSTNRFQWIAIRPHTNNQTQTTLISCVATNNREFLDTPDQQILHELYAQVPSLLGDAINSAHRTHIIRKPQAFLSCKPNISTFRPLQKSPVPNLFVAGPWTDTTLPASRESSILSGNLCAQAIIDSRSTH